MRKVYIFFSTINTNQAKGLNIAYNIFVVSYTYFNCVWGGCVKNKDIFKVFFREKPAMMLVNLKNTKSEVYASSLAKQIDCTYSHVVKILQQMEREGLINFDKQGRLKLLTLTKKGQDIASRIDDVRGMM